MARTFAAKRLAPHAMEWDAEKHFPVDVLREAAELGTRRHLRARGASAARGSRRLDAGADLRRARPRAVPRSRRSSRSTTWSPGWSTATAPTSSARRWLPRLCSMEVIASYCLTEPGVGLGRRGARTARRARRRPLRPRRRQAVHLGGRRRRPVHRDGAHRASRARAASRRCSSTRAPPASPSGGTRRRWAGTRSRRAPVMLDGVRVPVANRLGDGGRAASDRAWRPRRRPDQHRRVLARRRTGGVRQVARVRRASARPSARRSAALQTVQFQLADMATELEAARCLLWRAAAALDAGDAERDAALRHGQALRDRRRPRPSPTGRCSCTAATATCSEYGLEKIVRDLRVHQIVEGTNEIMRADHRPRRRRPGR